jgi:chorismate synthase
MQIERDEVELLGGVRAGETLGSPIAMLVRNRDWKNWQDVMNPAPREGEGRAPGAESGEPTAESRERATPRRRAVTRPRPGHADLAGLLKYDRDDARDILERASARETTARVAAGAICRRLLDELGVRIGSHLVHLGGVDARPPGELPPTSTRPPTSPPSAPSTARRRRR